MPFHATVRGERFTFAGLCELFARANEEKSGDRLAGLAADTERERVAAKLALADVTLAEIVDDPVIDPDADDVSRLILDQLDRDAFANERAGQQRERPAVAVLRGEQRRSRAWRTGADRRVNGGHARGERHGLTRLKAADDFLECFPGRSTIIA